MEKLDHPVFLAGLVSRVRLPEGADLMQLIRSNILLTKFSPLIF